MATFIRVLGLVVTVTFSIGATIGVMITMYAAVANRTREVGTLRGLGYRRRSILSAFLLEALLISFVGGWIGLLLAFFMQFFRVSTINFDTFTELSFGFALTPDTVFWTLLFSLVMGFVGGFLPAVRAASLGIVNALRST
ncbi:MAG: FtsX-like permease family protein [Bacteroidota bacterium]